MSPLKYIKTFQSQMYWCCSMVWFRPIYYYEIQFYTSDVDMVIKQKKLLLT